MTLIDDPQKTVLLYLAPWVAPGGADKGTVDWFRTLDRNRYELHLITTARSDENTFVRMLEPFAAEVWNLPDLLDEADFAPFVLAYIGDRGVRLVHIMNSNLGFDLIPYIRAAHPDVKLVVQHHAEEVDRSGYLRYVASRYGHLLDAYSATSEDLKRRIVDHGVDATKIRVIYTGIDAAREWRLDAPRSRRDRSRPLDVLFAGRLEDQKDPFTMVEVAAELARRRVDSVIHVVGDGSLRAETEARVAAAGLQEIVRFHGVSYAMRNWYERCDVLLMTSKFEGIPYVIFEAMAMEQPCVVPDVNANTELVDETVGIVVGDRTDIGAYAAAIERFAADPSLVARLGAASRARVVDRFPLEQMARQHEALYDELLFPAGSASPPTATARQ